MAHSYLYVFVYLSLSLQFSTGWVFSHNFIFNSAWFLKHHRGLIKYLLIIKSQTPQKYSFSPLNVDMNNLKHNWDHIVHVIRTNIYGKYHLLSNHFVPGIVFNCLAALSHWVFYLFVCLFVLVVWGLNLELGSCLSLESCHQHSIILFSIELNHIMYILIFP
jgi:hypothetical protein